MDLKDTNRKDPKFVEKIQVHPDIVYSKNGDREMLLNLYHPKNQKEKLPAIVCLHGGGWAKGKRVHAAHFAQALAERARRIRRMGQRALLLDAICVTCFQKDSTSFHGAL